MKALKIVGIVFGAIIILAIIGSIVDPVEKKASSKNKGNQPDSTDSHQIVPAIRA